MDKELIKASADDEKHQLDKIMYTAYDTLELSDKVKLELQSQGEIINKVEANLDATDRNLKRSEYVVRGMSSTFGFIRNLFTGTKKLQAPAKPAEE